jgi:hypothetical protein
VVAGQADGDHCDEALLAGPSSDEREPLVRVAGVGHHRHAGRVVDEEPERGPDDVHAFDEDDVDPAIAVAGCRERRGGGFGWGAPAAEHG